MILHVVSFSAESIIMIVLTEVMKKEEKKVSTIKGYSVIS